MSKVIDYFIIDFIIAIIYSYTYLDKNKKKINIIMSSKDFTSLQRKKNFLKEKTFFQVKSPKAYKS